MSINTLNLNTTQVEETGGGQIGRISASYPFAKLTVTRYCLTLNMGIMGKVLFRPSEVISIEPASMIKTGIRIKHRVGNYKENVVFTCSGREADLIARIEQSGFLNNMDPLLPADIEAEIAQAQASGSFGLRIWFVVCFIAIWNSLPLAGIVDVFTTHNFTKLILAARVDIGILALLTILVLFVPAVQQRAVKPGFYIKDMRSTLYFILLVGAVIFLALSFLPHQL
ncbi:hypothetical protein C8P68_105198 [Mucilaginibacter yixingensis]|uniref:Uncharacterized protein n=1 Tax=Mucilaginibacter yixingensis TaxID=1295612 RepID=A0A2T5J897_9SPHI|nr:hypothetical protein [Mucilaginibacter yixingensis]PTQ95691.1 hypothetical protein C8P68_105198 [Mucilaginibacter yixingensis]